MMQISNVSAEYLIFEERREKDQSSIADRELVQKLSENDKLFEQDKAIVKGVLETAYLLSSPSNRAHLERSLKQAAEGKLVDYRPDNR